MYYGVDQPQPQRRHLRAGPLSLVYESGEIRYIKLGDREIVRRVYVTLRDKNWATLSPNISNLQINADQDSFELAFDAEHRQGEVDFYWRGRVTGDARGTVTFSLDGQARSSFLQSRLGFCVLHPIRELAGTRCTVEQPNGSSVEREFPLYISPHQPFTNIRAIKHEVVPGLDAVIRFQGGVFEIEDQRNWTDGSYKTYCPPLCVPHPTEIKTSTQISQNINITLSGTALLSSVQPSEPGVVLAVSATPVSVLPRIGLGFACDCAPLAGKQWTRLKCLNLSHLRADLKLSLPEYRFVLQRAWAEAKVLGVPLEVALILSDDAERELEDLVGTVTMVKPHVLAWLVFRMPGHSSTSDSLAIARKHLLRYDKQAVIGGGTNANFAELNRSRPRPEDLDAICYSANPQVHASDNSSLVEALEAQAWTVISTKQWAQERPVSVTPITLKPRFNPYCQETGLPELGGLPSNVDPRQMSLFGAAWTLGSLKYLAESGADSATYFETQGWCGVQESESGSNRSGIFHSYPGSVFPLYHVLADVGEFAGARVVPTVSSDPLRVEGLALIKNGMLRLICANLTGVRESITVRGVKGEVCLRELNETNVRQAMLTPEGYRSAAAQSLSPSSGELKLDLPPYGIARMDAEVSA